MEKDLRQILINTILEYIPPNNNPTAYIADVLNLEREYVYRRLRGNTNFTIEEVATLAINLGFSVDNIIGLKRKEAALFETDLLHTKEQDEIHSSKLEHSTEIVRRLNDSHSPEIRWAGNTIPFAILSDYEDLKKFHFYKWLYQTSKIGPLSKFSDFEISDQLQERLKQYKFRLQPASHITFVIDNNFFTSVVRNIYYFYSRDLLTKDEVQILKKDLLEILNRLEQISLTGELETGGKMNIYISPISINSTYTHIEYNNHLFCQFSVFAVSTLNSKTKEVCDTHKKWIESVKKYSVLVTQCNEFDRYKYVNRQREIINQLDNMHISIN